MFLFLFSKLFVSINFPRSLWISHCLMMNKIHLSILINKQVKPIFVKGAFPNHNSTKYEIDFLWNTVNFVSHLSWYVSYQIYLDLNRTYNHFSSLDMRPHAIRAANFCFRYCYIKWSIRTSQHFSFKSLILPNVCRFHLTLRETNISNFIPYIDFQTHQAKKKKKKITHPKPPKLLVNTVN